MPLKRDSSKTSVSKNISTLVGEGRPHKQAVAIALRIQQQAKKRRKPKK